LTDRPSTTVDDAETSDAGADTDAAGGIRLALSTCTALTRSVHRSALLAGMLVAGPLSAIVLLGGEPTTTFTCAPR